MGSGNIGNNNVGDNNVGDNNVGNNNQGNNNKDSPDAGDSSDSDDDDICSNTDKIRTYVRFSDRKLKWGEASPWDVIGYLDSPDHQGPCTAPSSVAGENFTSCDNDEWTAMPTTLTTGMNFQETHLKITVDRSTTFGPGTFRAYKAALQEALREYNQGEMVDWWSSTRSCSSTGIGMGCFGSQQLKNSGIEPDGTKAQNTNTAGLSIDRYNGQTPCGHFRLDFAVDGQDPESGDQEACKATLLGLTGFAAAASALLPPMAILAGFFGAMQLVCDNFD
ncbi:MAG: hypothetical protein M1831_000486 [Alyxoria varia]|nr:MAG: hypothetical protein M1831_000486 [Alyxoria varia]